MSPVICFYEKNNFIWSTNYILYSCPDDVPTTDFLSRFQNEYYRELKIVKINYDALNTVGRDMRPRYARTAKADVFVLKDFEIINEKQLNDKVATSQSIRPNFTSLIDEKAFTAAVDSVKADICNGRFYQMNLTAAISAQTPQNFSSLDYFSQLSQKVTCPYRAYLPLENGEIICLSPELFLRKKNESVVTQPIKGTLVTGDDLQNLQLSAKENAELSMIVDLLRNDLNNLSCEKYHDSAQVNFHRQILPLGYTTHTYSEIEIKSSKRFTDILVQTFPGGSISGCPKIESLKKISEIETYQRDFYTGSIGWWQEDDFALNIAIRSLYHSQKNLYYFTGCGIVFESDPAKEWQEFLTKCSFLNLESHFEPILDTFSFCNGAISYLPEHIARSAQALQFQGVNTNVETIQNLYKRISTELLKVCQQDTTYKVRLIIEQNLKYTFTIEQLNTDVTDSDTPVKLQAVHGNEKLPQYKTTARRHWQKLLDQKKSEADDILVINSADYVCETSIYNLFYRQGEDFFTPPLQDGCLQGTFREHHIKKGLITVNDKTFKLSEKSLHVTDLIHVDLYVANSVRGLRKASLLF